MKKYIIKRLLTIIPMFFIVSFLSFILINLTPSDPAEVAIQATGVPIITEEMIEIKREELGLNDPFFTRYYNWLAD